MSTDLFSTEGALLASSGYRTGMLLNTLQGAGRLRQQNGNSAQVKNPCLKGGGRAGEGKGSMFYVKRYNINSK